MASVSFLITIVGLILTALMISPLYVLLSGIEDGVSVEVRPGDGSVTIIIYYNIGVPLTDVSIVIASADNTYTYNYDYISEGDVVEFEVPVEDLADISYVTVKGKVAGLYAFSMTVRR